MMTAEQQNVGKQKRFAIGKCSHRSAVRLANNNRVCEMHWFVDVSTNRLGTGSMSIAKKLKEKLVSQNYTCPYTGEKLVIGSNCHLDHIYPTSRFPELKNNIANV